MTATTDPTTDSSSGSPMPGTAPAASADPGRGRFRMAPDHVAALAQHLRGAGVEARLVTAHDALVAAGIVGADGAVGPEPADLVATFAAPTLLVDVETTSGGEVVGHVVAVRGRRGWALEGWPGTPVAEYVPFEVSLLVPTLARVVGLRRPVEQPDPAPARTREPIEVPVEVADRGLALAVAALAEPGGTAAEIATTVGTTLERLLPEASTARRFTEVLAALRLTWRVTVRAPEHVAVLAVVDTGPLGLWRRTAPPEPIPASGAPPDAVVRLEPVTPGELWNALVDLLPSGTTHGPGDDDERGRPPVVL